MPIGALSTTTPSSGDIAGTSGPAELKDIKAQLKASFPNFTTGNDVCTRTATQLNNATVKNAAETITGVWNFSGPLYWNGLQVATENFAASIAASTAFGLATSISASTLAAALGGNTSVTGSWDFANDLTISGGESLFLKNGATVASFHHDGTNLNIEEVSGTTDGFQIRDGIALRVYDPTDALFFGMSTGAANAFLSTNAGSIQVVANGAFDLVDGSVLRIRDAGATDFGDFGHDGADFNTTFTNTAEWNITGVTAVNLSGVPLATQAWTAGERASGKMTLALPSVAGTGSPVTQTGTTGTALSNVNHTSGSGNLELVNNGNYRLTLQFHAASWTGTMGTCGVKVKLNGVTDLVDFAFTPPSVSEQNTTRQWVDLYAASAGDDLQMQINLPVGLTLNTGRITLLVERVA